MRILVFGDSVAYGSWDTKGGWVDRLKRTMHKRTVDSEGEERIQILNLGIGGDTSTKILKRMRSEISTRYSKNWPFLFILSYGANDERKLNGLVETSLNQFGLNTKEIIDVAKSYNAKVLVVGPSPLGQPTVVFKDQEYSDERIKEYETRIKSIAEAADVPFVLLRPAFEQKGLRELFSYDGLHPNDKGHELIASTVKPALDRLLKTS